MTSATTAPSIRVVAAVIEHEGRYLITQRRPTAVMPLMWEFPGGRVEPGETNEDALNREMRHRLGVHIAVGALISFVSHEYDRYTVELHLYQCAITRGNVLAHNVNAFAWAKSDEFDDYLFTPADEASVATLLGVEQASDPAPKTAKN